MEEEMNYEKELEDLDNEKKKNMKENKYPPSLAIPEGEIKGKILSGRIKDQVTKDGPRKIVQILIHPEEKEYSWWINPKNPIWRELMTLGKTKGTIEGAEVGIVRTGTRKATRYVLKVYN